jgi:hypothetical protein
MSTKQEGQGINITPEQLQAMMSSIVETAVREARKPSEAEQKKLDKQAEQERKHLLQKVELQKVEAKAKEDRKRSCQHGTVHPGTGAFKHSWIAQVHTPSNSEPYFVPTCQQCQTQLGKIKATPAQVANGVNLKDIPNLNIATIEGWEKTYGVTA